MKAGAAASHSKPGSVPTSMDNETRMRTELNAMERAEAAGDRRLAQSHWMEFCRLHEKRSPEKVQAMEQGMGLNTHRRRYGR